MVLGDVSTWPAELLDYLDSQFEILLAHARHEQQVTDQYLNQTGNHVPWAMMPSNPHFHAHERASLNIDEVLKSTSLRGWHCTRLTEREVLHIKSYGMQPPNLSTLTDRIRRAQADGMVESEVAERLIAENQANDKYRRGMLWFCFFEPKIAGQGGIERFFRRWGGEALYNSHERDPVTGEALRRIGRPCLIQADVPISSIRAGVFFGQKVIRRYLLSRGCNTSEDLDHEDYSREPISSAHILRFVFHGEAEFAAITGCDSWEPPLDG